MRSNQWDANSVSLSSSRSFAMRVELLGVGNEADQEAATKRSGTHDVERGAVDRVRTATLVVRQHAHGCGCLSLRGVPNPHVATWAAGARHAALATATSKTLSISMDPADQGSRPPPPLQFIGRGSGSRHPSLVQFMGKRSHGKDDG
jgi:hypothetical protein